MPWGAVASAVVGGVMGSGGSSSSQTTTNEIDPRLAAYLYGEDGNGGLMSDMSKWYQANRSGMNNQMAQGLNTQWGVYNDPGTMAGYQQMASLGSGLMGAPVMGNPFSDGRASLGGGNSGGAMNLGLGSAPAAQPQAAQPQQFPSYQRAPGTVNASMAGPFSSAIPQWMEKPPVKEEEAPADPSLPSWAKGQKPNQFGHIINPQDGTTWLKGIGGLWQEAGAHTGGG